MILDSPFISGSMSFGIANPSATMHISASTGAALRVDGAGITNTGSLFVSSSGNVGIGTLNPRAKLDVSGSLLVSGSINATGPITGSSFTTTGTITAQTLVVQTITSSVSFITGSTKFGVLAANTHQFTGSVLITGSVGIGFPNPTSSLNINGNVSIGANLTSLMLPHGLDTNGRALIISGTGSANPNYGILFLANNTGNLEVETVLGGILAAQVITGSKSGTNTATKAAITFFSTGSGGSVGGLGGYITFSTRPNNAADDIGSYERMRIDTNGNVGINTTSPTSPLTIKSTSRGDMLRLSISGSSAVSDATGITFGSATYDKAQIIAYNENTGNAAGYLTFWTGGSPATTDMTERMRLKSDGSVYIGGTSMANGQKFGIIGSGVYDGGCIALQNTGTGGIVYTIFSTNSTFSQGAGNLLFYNTTSPLNNLILYGNGNYDFAGSDVSDRRLKQDIENINFGLNEIMALSPKSYHLKSQDNLNGENQIILRKRYGFIAQEVQPILPDTITGTETETEYLGLDYNGVLAVAVKAIQELKAEIDELKNK